MGCAASVTSASTPGQKPLADVEPVKQQVTTSLSSSAAPAAEQRETDSPPTSTRPTALDRVNTFGAGARDELESPNVRVAPTKRKQDTPVEDMIPTIIDEDEAEDEDDPRPKSRPAAASTAPAPAIAPGTPNTVEVQAFVAEDEGCSPVAPQPQRSESPDRRNSAQLQQQPQAQQQEKQQHRPKPVDGWFGGGGAGALRASDSQEFERLAPPSHSPQLTRGQGADAAGTGRGPASQVPTLPPLAAPRQAAPGRYDDITLSDDDDDDAQGFDMERWRRYYKWNRTKPADLLDFLWRRFDSRHFSIYVATYKPQDNLFAGFQGENVCHGLCCRLEKLRCDMFAVLNTYYASRADQYKVLGVFIFKGSDVPSELRALPDFEDYQLLKADTKDSIVRKFVGGLVTRTAPVPELSLVCSREFVESA